MRGDAQLKNAKNYREEVYDLKKLKIKEKGTIGKKSPTIRKKNIFFN